MTRLRLVAVEIVPQFVIDDGENLVPGPPVQPITVTSAEWPNVVEMIAKAIAERQAQMDAAAVGLHVLTRINPPDL